MAPEEVSESALHDCHWIAPVENVLTSCCPRSLRGFEKMVLPAETLAVVHDFSRYVLRHLYHPCNELGTCRKALNGGMAGVVAV